MSAATVIREDFDSWDAWIDCATDLSRLAWRDEQALGDLTTRKMIAWYGTATFAEAAELARYGWPAGRAMMAEAISIVTPARDAAPVWRYDVAGAFPDVARAAAGDPMSMLSPVRSARAARPIVRINYGRSTLSDVPSKAIMNRGAALLGIVDALEADGFSVELRLVFKSTEESDGSGTAYHSAVVVKRAGDPLDLDRAAFALVNPAVLRRLAFAMRQQHAALASWQGTMGCTDYSPWIDDDDERAIFVPAATAADSDPATARRAVEACFTDTGTEQ